VKRSAWLVLFLSVYVFALILTAPASLLDLLVQQATKGKMVLANCNGSLWNGKATPALLSRNESLIGLPSITWQLFPLDLLRAKFHVGLNLQDGSQPMDLLLTAREARLEHLFLPIPASLIGEMSPQLKPLELSGMIELRSAELTWRNGGLQGDVSGKWSEAATTLAPIAPIGQYALHMTANGQNFKINLVSQAGPLILAGEGNLSFSQGLTFNGTAEAASTHQETLAELLQHLGPAAGDGKRMIHITQNLSGI